jgi:hypothetical protein
MKKEQRDYLRARLGKSNNYTHSEYPDSKDMPKELIQAQKRIAKWENSYTKNIKQKNVRIRKAYDKTEEVIMGEDYDASLKAIQKFQETYQGKK